MKLFDSTTGREEQAESISGRELLTIVPRLPTKFCGVGDHALAVGESLSTNHDCRISYLGVNANSKESTGDGHWVLPERTTAALLEAFRSANLSHGSFMVLHFSGYSYGSRGVCFWLTRAIDQFMRERRDVRLITMFHELWAPAKLLSRSGWVVPIQKAIVRKLVQKSHAVRTNRVQYARQLELLCPKVAGDVRVRNICSNFGEPKTFPVFRERKKQILIFQPPDSTKPDGKAFWDGWEQLASQLGWPKTVVAGRTTSVPKHESIELRGFVSAEEGSRLMLESQFAYFDYYDGYLGKSSFFGSLAAHRIVPVMPGLNKSEDEGLFHQTHYLIPGDAELTDYSQLQAVSEQLHLWYADHSIDATAADYFQSMNRLLEKCA